MSADPNVDFITAGEIRAQKELLAGTWFQGVNILTNANGDLVAKIDEAIKGLGMFAIIRIYGGKIPEPGNSEPWNLEIVITENALLNRGEGSNGKTARLMVQKIIAARKVAVNLTDAAEIPSGDYVVWQLKGTIQVALPAMQATTPV